MSRSSASLDDEPELFVRGKATYKAHLTPESPLGTIASIEQVLRGLDRKAEEEGQALARQEKALADYREQLGRPFEHEARLKDLLAKQAQLNAALDLDKHEAQVVDEARAPEEKTVPDSFVARIGAGERTHAMGPVGALASEALWTMKSPTKGREKRSITRRRNPVTTCLDEPITRNGQNPRECLPRTPELRASVYRSASR